MEYSIGDLSKITRVGGKTLHQYHIDELVVPGRIDKFSGRRYYGDKALHRVEIIRQLARLGIPAETIKDILPRFTGQGHFRKNLAEGLKHSGHSWESYGVTLEMIENILKSGADAGHHIGRLDVKILPNVFVAGKRFTAEPDGYPPYLASLQQACDGRCTGNPIILFHDDHQYEDEIDTECCLPVSAEISGGGIACHDLKGARAVAVEYSGPASGLWRAYQKIVDHLNNHNLAIQSPSREVILDGVTANPGDSHLPIHVEVQFLTGDPDDPGFTRDVSRPGFGINAAFDL
jgi:DNA-binding transcriptional MerR regulator/effector-binding domain-containing protein